MRATSIPLYSGSVIDPDLGCANSKANAVGRAVHVGVAIR
jgi:hypothetical protein